MNERIRELALQARVQDRGYFIYQYDDHQSVEKAINLEKFAELIVYECMEQVHYTREDMINGNISQVIKDRIEKHFGVEE